MDAAYQTDKNNLQLIRFKNQTNAGLCIINVHLPYNDYEHRLRDLKTLMQLFEDMAGLEKGVKILLGDFNIWPAELKMLIPPRYAVGDGKKSIRTTISANAEKNEFISSYDHFVYVKDELVIIEEPLRMARFNTTTKEFILGREGNSGNQTFENSRVYRAEISDHVPIFMSIDLR